MFLSQKNNLTLNIVDPLVQLVDVNYRASLGRRGGKRHLSYASGTGLCEHFLQGAFATSSFGFIKTNHVDDIR